MKIVVLDDYADAFRQVGGPSRLAAHEVTVFTDAATDPDELVRRLSEADAAVLIQQRTPLKRPVIERLPKLRMISQAGTNLGHIDVAACRDRGILICTKGSGNPMATAELTWGLILSVLRDIPRQTQRLKDGHWLDSMGSVLSGRTLGVLGFGRIGSIVAGYGRAFGMRVVCWGRESSNAKAGQAGHEVAPDRDALFAMADVLSLHIALNDETRGSVTAADLARMKPSAIIVNTGRASLIEAGALEAALRAGRPGRAAVDVYEEEPVLGAAHPLIALPNVLCTPHLGYSVRETYDALFAHAVDQLLAFDAGEPIDVLGDRRP